MILWPYERPRWKVSCLLGRYYEKKLDLTEIRIFSHCFEWIAGYEKKCGPSHCLSCYEKKHHGLAVIQVLSTYEKKCGPSHCLG